MRFDNIIDWFTYVKDTTLTDLKTLFNDDYDIFEYLNNCDKCVIHESLIDAVKEKMSGTEYEERFWNDCLFYINSSSLTNDLIEYLIDNNIAVEVLGHMQLPDKYLFKITNSVDEAVITLGKRYYSEDKYSCNDLVGFLRKFKDNKWLWRTLTDMDSESDQKRKTVLKSLFSMTDFDDIKRNVIEQHIEEYLSQTKYIRHIKKYCNSGNYHFLRAVARNPITPVYILNELINIKNIKYANQIRTLASKNLSMKKH